MKKHNGFTLIEVLIALAILSIALTAIIKAASQNIRDTTYLQNKMMAAWVATYVINEMRVGILNHSNDEEEKIDMLNREWLYQAKWEKTPNTHIQKIKVKILMHHQVLANFESYLFIEQNNAEK